MSPPALNTPTSNPTRYRTARKGGSTRFMAAAEVQFTPGIRWVYFDYGNEESQLTIPPRDVVTTATPESQPAHLAVLMAATHFPGWINTWNDSRVPLLTGLRGKQTRGALPRVPYIDMYEDGVMHPGVGWLHESAYATGTMKKFYSPTMRDAPLD